VPDVHVLGDTPLTGSREERRLRPTFYIAAMGTGRDAETLRRVLSGLERPSLRMLARRIGVPDNQPDDALRAGLDTPRLTLSTVLAVLTPDALRAACARPGIDPALPRPELVASLLGTQVRDAPAKIPTSLPIRERLLEAAGRTSLQSMLGQSSVGRMVDDELWKLRGLIASLSDMTASQIATHMTDGELRTLLPNRDGIGRIDMFRALGIECCTRCTSPVFRRADSDGSLNA
jgi:hypothetical protein